MPVSRALRRLLRIRDLEEEQCRIALESAQGELNRLHGALAATTGRERRGRRIFEESARSGELADRFSGLEETRAAERIASLLATRIETSREDVDRLREEFLAKRVELRQAETLIKEAEAADSVEAARKAQLALDDWYRTRLHARGERFP
jgi:flagellar biosynthesis chaperone FliJ